MKRGEAIDIGEGRNKVNEKTLNIDTPHKAIKTFQCILLTAPPLPEKKKERRTRRLRRNVVLQRVCNVQIHFVCKQTRVSFVSLERRFFVLSSTAKRRAVVSGLNATDRRVLRLAVSFENFHRLLCPKGRFETGSPLADTRLRRVDAVPTTSTPGI